MSFVCVPHSLRGILFAIVLALSVTQKGQASILEGLNCSDLAQQILAARKEQGHYAFANSGYFPQLFVFARYVQPAVLAHFQELVQRNQLLRGLSDQQQLVSLYFSEHLVKVIDGQRAYELPSLTPLASVLSSTAGDQQHLEQLFFKAWQETIFNRIVLEIDRDIFKAYPLNLVQQMTFYGQMQLGPRGPTTHFFFFPVNIKKNDVHGVPCQVFTQVRHRGDYLVTIQENAQGEISSVTWVSLAPPIPWGRPQRTNDQSLFLHSVAPRKYQDYQVPALTQWIFARRMQELVKNHTLLTGIVPETRERLQLVMSAEKIELLWGQRTMELPPFVPIRQEQNYMVKNWIFHESLVMDLLAPRVAVHGKSWEVEFFLDELLFSTGWRETERNNSALPYDYLFIPAGGSYHNLTSILPTDTLFIMETVPTVSGGKESKIRHQISLRAQ